MIVPNWEKGDYRYVKSNMTAFTCINQDTIMNVNAGKLYKLTITDKTKDHYIVEVIHLSKTDITFKTSIDSMNGNLNKFAGIIQNLSKFSIPYKVKVSSAGEIEEIVDWKNVLNNFISKAFEIRDSIGFKPEEQTCFKQYVDSTFSLEKDLRNALLKDISDNFELYNIPIPKDSAVTKYIRMPNSKTGQITNTKVEYRTLSIKDGIYEVEMKINMKDLLFNSHDYIEDFFSKEKKKKLFEPQMDNYYIFYWNSNTSWIDSSKFVMDMHTDTIEIKMMNKTVMYK